MVKVSAIMSCYKSEPWFLERTIKSILTQLYGDFEFLIRSDGVNFDLQKFLEKFNDKRIKLLDDKEHRGNSGSHNYLMEHCNGEYIAIIDHDDEHFANHFQDCVEELDKDKSLFTVSGITINDELGKCPGRIIGTAMGPKEVSQRLLFYQPLRNPTVLMRREMVEKYNLRFDPNIKQACDYDFWARCRKLNHLILNKIMMKYYRHPGSDSSDIQKLKINHRNIVKRNLKEIGINASDKLVELISPFSCSPCCGNANIYIRELMSYKPVLLKEITESYFNEKLAYVKRRACGY